jgi:hypothetical protein
MSYTLRGRIESRLATLLVALVAALVLAAVLHSWWPVELVALMVGIGIALDVAAYHRLLPYQPGWAAVPLGALELALLMGAARWLGIAAPLTGAVLLFFAVWLAAQLLGHAVLPLARLDYAEAGGELGAGGIAVAGLVAVALVGAGGVAYAGRPPVVHLGAGVHEGPLRIDRRETLVGDPGAIVHGGIVVAASGVTIRNVSVMGALNGIVVQHADNVTLDRVSVSGAALDGIHVRDASVTIRDCTVDALGQRFGQGIDISYSLTRRPSMVSGCTVIGGQEGIVTHAAMAMLAGNTVTRTSLRAISMTEMSMGEIMDNEVRGALGVGIFCNDHSQCMVEKNVVAGTRPDDSDGDRSRAGFGFLASFYATATLEHNRLASNPHAVGSVSDALVEQR